MLPDTERWPQQRKLQYFTWSCPGKAGSGVSAQPQMSSQLPSERTPLFLTLMVPSSEEKISICQSMLPIVVSQWSPTYIRNIKYFNCKSIPSDQGNSPNIMNFQQIFVEPQPLLHSFLSFQTTFKVIGTQLQQDSNLNQQDRNQICFPFLLSRISKILLTIQSISGMDASGSGGLEECWKALLLVPLSKVLIQKKYIEN